MDQYAILMKSRVHKWKITWEMFYFLLALLFTNTKCFTAVSGVKSQKSLALEFWECDIHQWSHRTDHLPLSQINTPVLLYFNFIFKQKKGTTWDFPGGLVAKTLWSQCRKPGFDPSSRYEIPHATTKSLLATTKICCSQTNNTYFLSKKPQSDYVSHTLSLKRLPSQ